MLSSQQTILDLQHCFELLKVYPHVTSLCIDLEIAEAFLQVLNPTVKISEETLQTSLDFFVEHKILTAPENGLYSIIESK